MSTHSQIVRLGKVESQFIVQAFLKSMRVGGHFSFFIACKV